MEIELHDLLQEYCNTDFKNRNFTYSVAQIKVIFYLFGKKKISIFEELEVFDKLYGKYGLKSKGWSKFSAG